MNLAPARPGGGGGGGGGGELRRADGVGISRISSDVGVRVLHFEDGSAASRPGFVIEEESFEAEAGALWSATTPE